MKKNKHLGQNFDDFLQEEGILEEVEITALKSIIAKLLQNYMEEQGITQSAMAKKLQTSRSGLARLLDPNNTSVTLHTLARAAAVVGKKLQVALV